MFFFSQKALPVFVLSLFSLCILSLFLSLSFSLITCPSCSQLSFSLSRLLSLIASKGRTSFCSFLAQPATGSQF